jgi:nucleoside-diphosphate-sugar epimerase
MKKLDGMDILICGGSGFIGRYLNKELEGKEFKFFILDVTPPPQSSFTYVKGDVVESNLFHLFPPNVDTVIHLAAKHHDFGIKKEQYFKVNVEGMENLLKTMNKKRVKK